MPKEVNEYINSVYDEFLEWAIMNCARDSVDDEVIESKIKRIIEKCYNDSILVDDDGTRHIDDYRTLRENIEYKIENEFE